MCCDTYGTKIYKEGSKISSGTISGGDDSEWQTPLDGATQRGVGLCTTALSAWGRCT